MEYTFNSSARVCDLTPATVAFYGASNVDILLFCITYCTLLTPAAEIFFADAYYTVLLITGIPSSRASGVVVQLCPFVCLLLGYDLDHVVLM